MDYANIRVFQILMLVVQFQYGNSQEGSTTAVLYYNGEAISSNDPFNTVIGESVNISCLIENSISPDTTFTWNIEGTDTGDKLWSVVSSKPLIIDNKDDTWNIQEKINVTTTRHNSPGINIECIGNNTFDEYSVSEVIDVYAAPVGSVIYTDNGRGLLKRSAHSRTSREVPVETVINGEASFFTCEAWEANPAADINWFINDVSMNENVIDTSNSIWNDGYPQGHYTYDTYSTFGLTPSFPDHQGAVLSCIASNFADPMGISAEVSLDVIVLPYNVQVFVDDVEAASESTVVLQDAHPVVFTCFVEGAKPAASCYLIVNGVPSLLSGTMTTNPTSEILTDTTAEHEITPSLSDDGRVWNFVGYNGHGDLTAGVMITLDIRPELEAPVITDIPGDIAQDTDPNRAYATVTWLPLTASDDSGVVTLTSTHNPGDMFAIGMTTVIYTAIDQYNNKAETSFIITVADNEPPSILLLPSDITVATDSGRPTAVVVWDSPDATDNSGEDVTVTSDVVSGWTFPITTTTVSYTATDIYANSATDSFTVTVNDNEPPSISGIPIDITVNTDSGQPTAMVFWDSPDATDNSGEDVTVTSDVASGWAFPITTTIVTYTATDIYSNSVTDSFTVTVNDNEPPSILALPSDITVNTDVAQPTAVVVWNEPTVTDNSGEDVTVTSDVAPGWTFPITTTTVTYTATDLYSNSVTDSFIVTVNDNEPPSILGIPSDITVNTDVAQPTAVVVWDEPTVTDNSGEDVTVTSDVAPGWTFPITTTTVTYTAIDIYSNSVTDSFTVTVNDNEPPSIMALPSDITVNTDIGQPTAVVVWDEPTVTDNSGEDVTVTSDVVSGWTFPITITTVTFTATDIYANSVTDSFTVTVYDNEPPSILALPSDITVNTDIGQPTAAVVWDEPTVTDNSGEDVTVTSDVASGWTFPITTTTVTYTATDIYANSVTDSFTVTINDDEAPVFECPMVPTVYQLPQGTTEVTVTWEDPLVSDNSGEQVHAEIQPVQIDNGGEFPAGTYNIVYIATDSAGNRATCELVIIVSEYPVLICPGDMTVGTSPGEPTAFVSWDDPVRTDTGNSGSVPDPDLPPGEFGIGTNQVVYDFEADGFKFYCTFSVTVEDREPPMITCPANIEERAREGESVAFVSWSIPSVSDNSGDELIIYQITEQEPGRDFTLGDYTIMYSAVDESGNQHTCTFTLSIIDLEQPELECPNDITVETLKTESMVEANWNDIAAIDNSGDTLTVSVDPPSGSRFPIGVTPVIVSAVDSSGNEASCTFNIKVEDHWPPSIECPSDIEQETDPGSDSSVVVWTIIASDNSQDIVILSGQLDSGDTLPDGESPLDYQFSFPIGDTLATFEASDTSLNIHICSFEVAIQDNEPPVFVSCPEDIVEATDTGVNKARVSWLTPQASDNSNTVLVEPLQYSPGEEFTLDNTPISIAYQAVDGSGNTETCMFTVEIEDIEAPRFINCPSDITESAAELASDAVVSWNPPRTKDNSDPYTSDDPPEGTIVTAPMKPGDSFPLGVTQVNYTATDAAGNVGVCSFFVTVQGPDFPSIICPEDVRSPTESGTNKTVILLLNQVSVTHPVENAQNIVIESDAPSGNEYYIGVTEVTFTAIDSSGNMDSCTVTVIVQDEESPTFTQCPENIEQNLPSGTSRVEITWEEPSVVDNSGIPPTVSSSRKPGDFYPVGEFIVEYEATDASGNIAYCSFRVIIGEYILTTTVKPSTTSLLTTTMKPTTTMSTTKLPTTVAIDPCAENGPCPNDAICQITNDAQVTCVCQSGGFSWDEATKECSDMDECIESSVCPAKSQCDNTDGSYECLCKDGFDLQESASGDLSCVDIDECENENQNDCDINAVCMNNPGSFTCICKEEDNFKGNGRNCEAVNPCEEPPCKNDGTCFEEDNDDGFICECPTEQWMGKTCDIEVEPVGDPEVLSHPQSKKADAFEVVKMSASFKNIDQIRWFHNDVNMPDFNDQSTLQIFRVAAGDEGYYHAIGIGPNGQVQTEKALLQINDLAIFPANMTFNTRYVEESLSQIEEDLLDFLRNGLEDSPRYSGDQAPNSRLEATSPGSVKARMKIYKYNVTTSKYPDSRNVLVQALLHIAYNSNGYLDPDSISVDSTVTCFESTWKSSYGPVIFPTSLVEEMVFSLEYCPWYTRNDGEPIAYADCRSDFVSPAVLVPTNNCGGNLTIDEQLAKLDAVTVTESNLQEVTREVEQLTGESDQVQADGVASVANILVEVANLKSTDPQVTTAVIETLDNLFNVDDEYLEMAQEQEGSINKAVQAMETQLQHVQLSINGSYSGTSENIVVEIREVMPEDFQRGVGFGSFSNDESGDIEDELIMVLENSEAVVSARATATALIVLPSQLIEEANIAIGKTDAMIRVTFVIYEEDTLFKSRPNKLFNDEQEEVDRAVNTRIVSCTVGNQVITSLQEPVEIIFKVLRNSSEAQNRSCVFWDVGADDDQGDWSPEGCYLSNNTDDHVACKCNHLTNFAVLMDIYGQSTLTDTQNLILEILSYIGCGLSIIGLVATMYSYAAQPKLRSKQPNKILLNLCAALLGLYCTFIVMIAIDTKRNHAEVGIIPCSILAGLIQYFTLASLFWMGVEGVNMYLLFVKVVNSYISDFMLKARLAAWGVPLIVAVVTGAATREEYLIEGLDFCFLRRYPLIGGLMVPIAFIIIFNAVVFVMVLRRISASVAGKVQRKSKTEQFKKRLINATCIFVLMGLAWSLGYLSVIYVSSFIVQMVFCVLNSMQGYVIFMLYVMRRGEVRKVWSSVFRSTRKQSAFSSSSPQSSPRARPRNQSNTEQPQTDSRQFSNSGPSRGRRRESSYRTGPNKRKHGFLNSQGARSRFFFAHGTVPMSTVEANRMNDNDLDDTLGINDDNENFFDINRINEGLDISGEPNAAPNVAEPDISNSGNPGPTYSFEHGYF